MDCARELNRGRCADMWVSPHIRLISKTTIREVNTVETLVYS